MLTEYSVRIRTEREFHFIVPVCAGSPDHADRYARSFIRKTYGEKTVNSIVRYKGRALPVWCEKAKRTPTQEANGL